MPDSVKGISQVKLEDEPFFLLGEARMNGFLHKNNGISDLPIRQETSLIFRDQRGKEGFEARG